MTKNFADIIDGIRKAVLGVEVREDIAQGMEYVEQFATTATKKADEAASSAAEAKKASQDTESAKETAVSAINTAKSEATDEINTEKSGALTAIDKAKETGLNALNEKQQAALDSVAEAVSTAQSAAGTATEQAAAAATQATAAASSASAAKTSESNAKASETESAKNLQGTKEYFEQVRTITIGAQGWYATPEALKAAVPVGENGWWAVVGTTDTIWTWDGDTGAWVNTQAKVDLSDFYTQEQVDALLKAQKLADHPVGSAFFTISDDSPAQLFGGTWMKVASDRAIMGASTTHPAGTTVEAGLPNITGSLSETSNNGDASPFRGTRNSISSTGALAVKETASSYAGYSRYDGSAYNISFNASKSNAIYGRSDTVQPAAYYINVWIRLS